MVRSERGGAMSTFGNTSPGPRPQNSTSSPKTAPGSSTSSRAKDQVGRPPKAPFIAFLLCEILPILLFFLGRSTRNLSFHVIGFLLGTFIGVIAFAVFLVQDNGQRTYSYRDWRISPRDTSNWIVVFGFFWGFANMFLVAIELSRSLVK